MDLAKNQTVRKIIIPLVLASLLRMGKLASIATTQQAINALLEIAILTAIFLLGFKIIPRIFDKIKQG
jgi:hypothetical protein